MMPTQRQIETALLFAFFAMGASLAAFPQAPAQERTAQPKERVDKYGDPLPAGAVARMGAARFRSDGETTHLTFSADGKKLAAESRFSLIVWDAETGKLLQRFSPEIPNTFRSLGTRLALSPDGTTLAVLENSTFSKKAPSGKLHFIGLPSGKKLPMPAWVGFEPTRGAFAQFSPDGKALALAQNDGKLYLLDLTSDKARLLGEAVREKGNLPVGFYDLAFSADGKSLAAASMDLSFHIWDLATGKVVQAPAPMKPSRIDAIAFAPDGKSVAWANQRQITLSDVKTGRELDRFVDAKQSGCLVLRFSSDGKTLIAGQRDGKVRLWDVASGEIRSSFQVGLPPDAQVDVFGGSNKASKGKKLTTPQFAKAMAVSPDGQTLAVGTADPVVRLWNVETGKEVLAKYPGHDSPVTRLAFTPGGKTLFSASDRAPIRVWDAVTGAQQRTLTAGDQADMFSLSPDGKRLAVVANGKIHVKDAATGKDALVISAGQGSRDGIVFSADGKLHGLEVQGSALGLRTWDADTGKELSYWRATRRFNNNLILSSTALLASGSGTSKTSGETTSVYDLASGRERAFKSPTKSHDFLAISPDGRLVVDHHRKGSLDFLVEILDAANGQEVLSLAGHKLPPSAAAWSPDGRIIATGDNKKGPYSVAEGLPLSTIRLWDAFTGKGLATFGGFGTEVMSLAFAPNGSTLAAGLVDGTILTFDVSQFTPKLAPMKLSKQELEARWLDLGGADAVKAYKAATALIAAADQTVPFLKARLKPVAGVDPKKIQQWVADLGSDQSAVRLAAVQELQKYLPQAEIAIRNAQREAKSPEAQRHAERLMGKLDGVVADTLITLRAISVLEKIGTAEARGALETLAGGAPGVRETEEARAALARLRLRHGV